MEKPRITVNTITAVGVNEEGQIVITKRYLDRIECITFDDIDEIDMFLSELENLLPSAICPKCGKTMTAGYVKEYVCDGQDCQLQCSESYLEYYDFIQAETKRQEAERGE